MCHRAGPFAVDGQFRHFHPAAKDQPVYFSPASATSIPTTASYLSGEVPLSEFISATHQISRAKPVHLISPSLGTGSPTNTAIEEREET